MRALKAAGVLCAAGGFTYMAASPQMKYSMHVNVIDAGNVLLRQLDPETSHKLAVMAAANGLLPRAPLDSDPVLATTLWGKKFDNPLGLAAGFDKNAEAVVGMLDLGFGFVEVGTITPKPQEGNPKPRVFRLPEDQAVINRYGFNNAGIDAAFENLERGSPSRGLIGINVGKNKVTPEEQAHEDYSTAIRKLGGKADYLVINISSPNTPGLRALQKKDALSALIKKASAARDEVKGRSGERIPLLVKIAPDLTMDEKKDIAKVVLGSPVDGLIVSNTTCSRPDTLRNQHANEGGGLSGAPLRDMATRAVHDMYTMTNGKVPIIGVGGVSSGRDAFEKIVVGASLVQMYSMLVFEGPGCVQRTKQELSALLHVNGFSNVQEAVGAATRDRTFLPECCK